MEDKTWKSSSYCQTLLGHKKIPFAIFLRRMLCCDFLFPRRRVLLERCKNVKFCTNINNDKKIKRQETGIKGLLLLHDSAPAHKSKLVTDFLSVEGVSVIRRPAYPPENFMSLYFILQ